MQATVLGALNEPDMWLTSDLRTGVGAAGGSGNVSKVYEWPCVVRSKQIVHLSGAPPRRAIRSDLPPSSRTSLKLVKSVNPLENDGYEEEQIQRGTDH